MAEKVTLRLELDTASVEDALRQLKSSAEDVANEGRGGGGGGSGAGEGRPGGGGAGEGRSRDTAVGVFVADTLRDAITQSQSLAATMADPLSTQFQQQQAMRNFGVNAAGMAIGGIAGGMVGGPMGAGVGMSVGSQASSFMNMLLDKEEQKAQSADEALRNLFEQEESFRFRNRLPELTDEQRAEIATTFSPIFQQQFDARQRAAEYRERAIAGGANEGDLPEPDALGGVMGSSSARGGSQTALNAASGFTTGGTSTLMGRDVSKELGDAAVFLKDAATEISRFFSGTTVNQRPGG